MHAWGLISAKGPGFYGLGGDPFRFIVALWEARARVILWEALRLKDLIGGG
jgi:hypothetical protein